MSVNEAIDFLMNWQDLDQSWLEAIHRATPASWEPWMQAITTLGSLEVLGALVVLVVAVLAWLRQWQPAITLAVSGLLTLLLRQALKELFHRPRPELWATLSESTYSFPSGHALGSVIIYGMLIYLLSQRRPRWRVFLWGLYGVLVIAIGFSRLYLGLHWPTDVLGGWAFGALALFGLIFWHERHLGMLTHLWNKLHARFKP